MIRERAERLLGRELERFEREHPRSRELARRAHGSLLSGVRMHWMVRWPGGFPIFADEASGARFRDVDGIEYVDFCLGDTGAMTGHSPEPVVRAVAEQAARGITLMLPTEEALWVGEELTRRFGLPSWQFALTATDANRFAIRLARRVTWRPKVLVFNWCYHGTVDETFATLRDGRVVEREGNLGPPVPLDETTRVVEWNDVDGLERELRHGDVACVQYLFRPDRPVTGSDAAAGEDTLLDRLIHLYALNRGLLLTPFHNMALMSPATTDADVDLHTAVFGEVARELTAQDA